VVELLELGTLGHTLEVEVQVVIEIQQVLLVEILVQKRL
jgi:hypothetical protein